MPFVNRFNLVLTMCCAVLPVASARADDALLGTWAFQLPDGNPAWLQVERGDAGWQATMLWSVGSAKPVKNLQVEDGVISFERRIQWKPYGHADNVKVIQKPIQGKMEDGHLVLNLVQTPMNEPLKEEAFTLVGKPMPPIPPRPDLAKVRFGTPIALFNGRDLSGWRLSNPSKQNGWRAEKGVLVNETPKKDFGAYGDYGNLITERKFMDFRLSIEYNVEAGANSGIYLRGAYEAQVVDRDSRMQGIQGPGAIFGRIAPSKNAGKPGGQWNRYVLTLVDRHITVVLNDELVIDNEPLVGCTGGGISADDTVPGPIFLQGDHTSVRYRNILLEPVVR